MKLDRLVGILSVLLQKEQVTAPQLAEKFEVSVRTILRDLDALSQAGIPMVTRQGSGGGISILEGYKLERTVEPYYLLFRWSSWYLWGWCTQRQDWRLFKLNRMDHLTDTGKAFAKRSAPYPNLSSERVFPGGIQVRARFEPNCKWRLVEEFGPNCFTEEPDGRLLFEMDFTNEDNLMSWLLTFGPDAELLEPAFLRDRLKTKLSEMLRRYE